MQKALCPPRSQPPAPDAFGRPAAASTPTTINGSAAPGRGIPPDDGLGLGRGPAPGPAARRGGRLRPAPHHTGDPSPCPALLRSAPPNVAPPGPSRRGAPPSRAGGTGWGDPGPPRPGRPPLPHGRRSLTALTGRRPPATGAGPLAPLLHSARWPALLAGRRHAPRRRPRLPPEGCPETRPAPPLGGADHASSPAPARRLPGDGSRRALCPLAGGGRPSGLAGRGGGGRGDPRGLAERAGVCAGGSGPERGAGAAAGGWGRPAARAAERRGATLPPSPPPPLPRPASAALPASMNRLGPGPVGSATAAAAAGQYRVCGNCRKVPRQVPGRRGGES